MILSPNHTPIKHWWLIKQSNQIPTTYHQREANIFFTKLGGADEDCQPFVIAHDTDVYVQVMLEQYGLKIN